MITKELVTKISELYKFDMEDFVSNGTLSKSSANNIFRALFENEDCVGWMRNILNTSSQQDRFDGFRLETEDTVLHDYLLEYAEEVSDCNFSEHHESIELPFGRIYVIGAYQDDSISIMDGQDYEDTWDYAFVLELN